MRLTLRYRFGWKETVLLLHEEGIACLRRYELSSLEVVPGDGAGRSTEFIEVTPYLKRGVA